MQVKTTSDFEANVSKLIRTYRLIGRDIARLSLELESGARPQDARLQRIGVPHIYKARLSNTSARRGARGGFRVIYRVTDDTVLLLLIWSKSHRSDIPDSEIRRIAMKY